MTMRRITRPLAPPLLMLAGTLAVTGWWVPAAGSDPQDDPRLQAAPPAPPASARVEQIPMAPAYMTAEPPLPPPDARAPGQISRSGTGVAIPAQASSKADSRGPIRQLEQGHPTADASDPLSSPAQSRPGGVVRVAGRDRCDPEVSAADPAICQRVIETRAGEFSRPDPLRLSPEQRLLVDQRLRQAPTTADNAARRFGRDEVDAAGGDAQGIAAMLLRQPSEPPPPAAPGEVVDPRVLQIIDAVTGSALPVAPPQ